MALIDLEDKILEIVHERNDKNFIFDFLNVYDIPKATVTKLRSGTNNLSKKKNEFHLKNKLYFKETDSGVFESFAILEEEVQLFNKKPRYLLVTDYKTLLAKDTQTLETLDISFKELPFHFDFFLAWNGIEKVDFQKENPLDIKAAERFARLFDVLNKEIDSNNSTQRHALNIFLMRLLFCLFAEDTGIFKKDLFTNGIRQYTDEDGKNINKYIDGLFKVLDLPLRNDVDTIYKDFPYVNGQLFTEPHKPIIFNYKARKLLIECGEMLEWSKINPDIFGSMIQAVATEDSRSHLGMHYTSVPNIMKVINPLFLEELNDKIKEIKISWENSEKKHKQKGTKYQTIRDSHEKQLSELMNRIRNMKFFDPACGSGNFLIITYKELRKLEIELYRLFNEIKGSNMLVYDPIVNLSQFYGIEIDEFASDIAKLSLWIAEHQMNLELKEAIVDVTRPTLPLKIAGDIRNANALKEDWLSVCPRSIEEEVFVFGNPPYLGSKKQKKEQKDDMEIIFNEVKNYKILDYISAWFKKGSHYISGSKSQLAFVSVDSITQGEQIFVLWTDLYKYNIDIHFAYQSFRWSNNAKNKAVVIVRIIGLRNNNTNGSKYLFFDNNKTKVEHINPYLTEGESPLVEKSNNIIFSGLPKMKFGNMPNGKDLILTKDDYTELVEKYPTASKYFRKYIGSDEFLNGKYRYCLWLTKNSYQVAKEIPEIHKMIENVRKNRLLSSDSSANRLAEIPYKFRDTNEAENRSLIVPSVSSENRYYIPMGFVDKSFIASNLVNVIYDAPIYMLGILMSRMHMVWAKSVGGKKGSSYRYTIGLCYNTFPFRELSEKEKKKIEILTFEILDIREEDGRTLAEMYNPTSISEKLITLHNKLDLEVDKIYSSKLFNSDEERLTYLLKLYARRSI